MLAVLPEYRNHGVGRRLKEYQRDVLRGLGVETIQWTFDPLVARNAHLNLNRLGAVVDAYVPDMYGDTGSALHAFGTDRFIVSWAVSGAGSPRPLAQLPESWRRAPAAQDAAPGSPVVRIEIPRDVEGMKVEEARMWRARTREAFVRVLGSGYRVAAFVPGAPACAYILVTGEGEDGS
jgi:predicted GNAT superfamily acetyltransferase